LFQNAQWLKKRKSNKKRADLGLKKIDLQYLDTGLHVVFFVNWEYPIEELMDAVADCSCTWFSEHAVNGLALEWRRRKSYPIIFKVPNIEHMNNLLHEKIHKTVAKIGDDPIAICFGPMYNSQVLCYNDYQRIQ
jgi:hypothetical protein